MRELHVQRLQQPALTLVEDLERDRVARHDPPGPWREQVVQAVDAVAQGNAGLQARPPIGQRQRHGTRRTDRAHDARGEPGDSRCGWRPERRTSSRLAAASGSVMRIMLPRALAIGDPEVRAVLATIVGEDQITVIRHLDAALIEADPKPFLGYSDNTNALSWLWTHGVAGFYGGSTQVHLGPGPAVDPCHRAALWAALLTGERLELTDPGESEDIGKGVGRSRGVARVRRPRTDRGLELGRPGAHRERAHVGRLHRSAPVDPHLRPLPRRPGGARRWCAAAVEQRGARART